MFDSAIHDYSENGHLNELISEGGDVNKTDNYGDTPLHRASI